MAAQVKQPTREGEYPGAGERWAIPREIARGALDRTCNG